MPTRTRRTLTPVTVTRRCRTFRSGRLENWEAVSDDGIWAYHRLEISGTPWAAEHIPSGIEADWYSTLPDARAATADGTALAAVERILAHRRGAHRDERDIQCREC